jgi:hypothetical protein
MVSTFSRVTALTNIKKLENTLVNQLLLIHSKASMKEPAQEPNPVVVVVVVGAVVGAVVVEAVVAVARRRWWRWRERRSRALVLALA